MRFKALNTFTDKLPLIEFQQSVDLIGHNTEHSILSGVVIGTIAEMDGIIDRYQQYSPALKVLLTGGDTNFFESRLKNEIFAHPFLLFEGLNKILIHNAAQT